MQLHADEENIIDADLSAERWAILTSSASRTTEFAAPPVLSEYLSRFKRLLRCAVFETYPVDKFPELCGTRCSDGSIR